MNTDGFFTLEAQLLAQQRDEGPRASTSTHAEELVDQIFGRRILQVVYGPDGEVVGYSVGINSDDPNRTFLTPSEVPPAVATRNTNAAIYRIRANR